MLLDTNAYSALACGTPSIVSLLASTSEVELPLPVIAELRYGFANSNQLEKNEQTLQRFLAQDIVSILVPDIETTEYYADLQLFCKNKGNPLSQNDIWIAALARQHNVVFVTFDKDFLIMQEIIGKHLVILD